MNRVILMGRLTRDPEVRYSQGEHVMAVARYTLAVDRRVRRNPMVMNRQLILSIALHLTKQESLQKNIFARV